MNATSTRERVYHNALVFEKINWCWQIHLKKTKFIRRLFYNTPIIWCAFSKTIIFVAFARKSADKKYSIGHKKLHWSRFSIQNGHFQIIMSPPFLNWFLSFLLYWTTNSPRFMTTALIRFWQHAIYVIYAKSNRAKKNRESWRNGSYLKSLCRRSVT